MNQHEPLQHNYVPPPPWSLRLGALTSWSTGLRSCEELTPAQAEKWLNQFAAIHRYVCTSQDQL